MCLKVQSHLSHRRKSTVDTSETRSDGAVPSPAVAEHRGAHSGAYAPGHENFSLSTGRQLTCNYSYMKMKESLGSL